GAHFQSIALPRGFTATGGIAVQGSATWLTVAQTDGRQNAVIMTTDGGRSWRTVWTERTAPIYTLMWDRADRLYVAGGNIAKFQQQPAEVIWVLRPRPGAVAKRFTWIRGGRAGGAWQPIVDLKPGPGGTLYALCGGNSMGANLPAPGPLLQINATGMLMRQFSTQLATSLSVTGNSLWLTGGSSQGIGLMRSADGGRSWQVSIQPRDIQAQEVQFVSRRVGFVQTQVGQYETTDGGRTWRPISVNTPSQMGTSVQWITPGQADIAYSTGIVRTNDGGRSWRAVRMPARTPQMYATTALPGGFFAIAYSSAPDYSAVNFAATRDNGTHWMNNGKAFGQGDVADLAFANQASGVAYVQGTSGVGSRNSILLTVDGGRHWSRVPTAPLRSVMWPLSMTAQGGLFFPANDGAAYSSTGRRLATNVLAYRAPNGRATVYRLGLHQPASLDFVTRSNGWFVDIYGSALYHTDNGGRTWTRIWI
ncbi:MAG: hypothetical protein ACYCOU_22185, partial [Sulfobacillus sp.]